MAQNIQEHLRLGLASRNTWIVIVNVQITTTLPYTVIGIVKMYDFRALTVTVKSSKMLTCSWTLKVCHVQNGWTVKAVSKTKKRLNVQSLIQWVFFGHMDFELYGHLPCSCSLLFFPSSSLFLSSLSLCLSLSFPPSLSVVSSQS